MMTNDSADDIRQIRSLWFDWFGYKVRWTINRIIFIWHIIIFLSVTNLFSKQFFSVTRGLSNLEAIFIILVLMNVMAYSTLNR